MIWIGLVLVAVGVVFVAARLRGGLVSGGAGSSPNSFAEEERIAPDQLRATLERAGIDVGSTNIPDPEILRPYLSENDGFLGAVQARRGNKRAILVALEDRLVAGEATLGTMGAEVLTFAWGEIDSMDQTFDVGGELAFEVDDLTLTYSHLPRSQTREFTDLLRERVPSG